MFRMRFVLKQIPFGMFRMHFVVEQIPFGMFRIRFVVEQIPFGMFRTVFVMVRYAFGNLKTFNWLPGRAFPQGGRVLAAMPDTFKRVSFVGAFPGAGFKRTYWVDRSSTDLSLCIKTILLIFH